MYVVKQKNLSIRIRIKRFGCLTGFKYLFYSTTIKLKKHLLIIRAILFNFVSFIFYSCCNFRN